jgi:hypothetical protein
MKKILCAALAAALLACAARWLLPYRWLERPTKEYVSIAMSDLQGNTAKMTASEAVAGFVSHVKRLPLWQMQRPGTPDYERDNSDRGIALVFTRQDGATETLRFWGTLPRIEKSVGPVKWAVSAKTEWIYTSIHRFFYNIPI